MEYQETNYKGYTYHVHKCFNVSNNHVNERNQQKGLNKHCDIVRSQSHTNEQNKS